MQDDFDKLFRRCKRQYQWEKSLEIEKNSYKFGIWCNIVRNILGDLNLLHLFDSKSTIDLEYCKNKLLEQDLVDLE